MVSLKGIFNALRHAVSFTSSSTTSSYVSESQQNAVELEKSYDKSYDYLRNQGYSDLDSNKIAKKWRRLHFEGRDNEIDPSAQDFFAGITGSP